MPSLLQRLSAAARAFRGTPPIDVSLFSGGWGLGPLFKPQQSLQAYDDNVYLHRAVQTIALEGARTLFRLAEKTKDGLEYVESHQALQTLRLPQPTKGGKSMLTAMGLKLVTFMHLLLNGEAFWLLDRRQKVSGSPTFIQPLLPQFTYANLSESGDIIEYTYRTMTRETKLDPLDVVHFKLPDPENIYRGNSPVQAIRYALDTHKKADVMNTRKLDNVAAPAGVLTSTQQIAESERRKILADFKQMYGGIENVGKVAMLPNGLNFQKTQESNQEMQFTEGKNLVRDEVLANYGVGLEILGQTDSVTRANAEATVFVFQRFGVLPFVELFCDTLNNDYLPAFPGTDGLSFTFADPVPANMEEKRLNMQTAFGLGAVTPNEVRKELGLEPLELDGMDTPYLPIGVSPVDSPPLAPLALANTHTDY